jgi:excinuclease UvrABC helicase subunit UvrB
MQAFAFEALSELIDQFEVKMKDAAQTLEFPEAAILRDQVEQLLQRMAASH